MDEKIKPMEIVCAHHGRCVAAVLCGHLLGTATRSAGFVENSSHPDDRQAWCDACEAKFSEEGGMTDAFKSFHRMSIVCVHCYEDARRRHAVPMD